eukprot:9486684-Pyramimonas_sp.AAC.1
MDGAPWKVRRVSRRKQLWKCQQCGCGRNLSTWWYCRHCGSQWCPPSGVEAEADGDALALAAAPDPH